MAKSISLDVSSLSVLRIDDFAIEEGVRSNKGFYTALSWTFSNWVNSLIQPHL